MVDSTGTVALVYNGEIYNYRELRGSLEARGRHFKTSSDTEVLLNLYLEYGERCVAMLQGMFAFAVWDGRTETMLVARDRFGIKPVYYACSNGCFAFASEIKALLALGLIDRSVNRRALHDYLTFRYTVAPTTMFEGINKLQPAHYAVVSRGGIQFTRYWSLDFSKNGTRSDEEWIHAFRSTLDDAVKCQLVSDVPVGLMLSGGLDSSVLAAAMRQEFHQPIKTFSVAMSEGDVFDERPFARLMAKHIGADHHEILLSAQDFIDTLPAFVWHMDEPVADPAAVPLYCLAKEARRHVTVVLSGEGSDEILGGYPFWTHIRRYDRLKRLKTIPAFLRNGVLGPLNRRWLRSERVEQFLEMCNAPLSSYSLFNLEFQDNVFSEEEKGRLYAEQLPGGAGVRASIEHVRKVYKESERFELLDQMLSVAIAQWLPEDLLVKADKMTMAHSLELRVPFLDERVVELAARMPTNLKIRGDGGRYTVKYALKKAYETALPSEIVRRDKLGFPVPYARWMKHEMRDMTNDILLSKSAKEGSPWKSSEVELLLARVMSRDDRAQQPLWDPEAKKVWSLLVFEMWRKAFCVSM